VKKIVIIGSTLSGNKGAAAMLESSIQTLGEHHPDAQFTLLSYIPPKEEQAKNTYQNLQILKATPLYLGVVINSLALLYRLLPSLRPLLKKNKAINALAEADVLLDQGGITFVDGREKFLLYNVASILPALMVKTKAVKCAQALGPFNNPINRLAAKIFLPKVTKIISRGAVTHEYLLSLGLQNIVAGADYAFLLELSNKEKQAAKKRYDESFFKGHKVVGLSPSVVMRKKVDATGKNYALLLASFINHLEGSGHRTVLLPHSARAGTEKTHNNDLPLCRAIYAKVERRSECLFIDDELTSQELRSLIGKCDLFIASRFHAMVSSLAMQVPTLVIGWSHKYREVLEMFGLESWAFGHDKLTFKYLQRRFEQLEKNQSQIRGKLADNLPKVKAKARVQVDVIEKILGED
jgi:polysaccharide pyruvyl transferase WcaK-like protein